MPITLLFPKSRNVGKHNGVPPTFLAVGAHQGGITQVRGRYHAAALGAWSAYLPGTVKANGYWHILFSIPAGRGYAESALEVQGFDGANWLAPVSLARVGILPPTYGAPMITYPPNDNPYVIEGAEQAHFVAQGTTNAALTAAYIQIQIGNNRDANDFDTDPAGTYWYAYFQNLAVNLTGQLIVTNATGPSAPEAVTVV